MNIRTRPLMTLRLRVGTPQIVGQTPIGDRRIVPVLDVADRDTRRRMSSNHAAGITSSDKSGAVIIPPTIGAAILCITSEPVPLPIMIGSNPARMTATVIDFGRVLSTAPSSMASRSACSECPRPRSTRRRQADSR